MNKLNYQQALLYLGQLEKFGIKLGLEQTRRLMDGAGSPDRRLRFIHVAGTNGKGSCCAMLEAALRKAGYTTGLYTSPHLISPCERIRINGMALSEEQYADIVSLLKPIADNLGGCPTYFEFTTVMAVMAFERARVDFVIWETGMGGRFDSTNVVDPLCAVITSIALDHEKYLGADIPSIAREKAGIIKPSRPVFCAQLADDAFKVILTRCREVGAWMHLCDHDDCTNLKIELTGDKFQQSFDYSGYRIVLSLPGALQRRNFQIVYGVLLFLAQKHGVNLELALSGLAEVKWPARMQFLPDGSLLDGAHNPEGAQALAEALKEILPDAKFTIIMAGFADKDTAGVIRALEPVAAEFIFIPIQVGDRHGHVPEELAAILHEFSSKPAATAASLDEALKLPVHNRRLFAGSLFLAGEVLEHYYPARVILNLNSED